MRHGLLRAHVLSAAALLAGCGANADPGVDADTELTDASESDAVRPDAITFDARSPDAFDLCPGRVTFTGEYVDWDSTEADFHGIADALVAEVGDPANTTTTAPNGRSVLCLPEADADGDVTFRHAAYLPLTFAVSASAALAGPYTARGLTPVRADALFADELGVARDGAAAQVAIDLRAQPGGASIAGATVALSAPHAGAFTPRAGEPGFFFFANVDPTGGVTAITITPPAGTSCVGRAQASLIPGEVTHASFACS
jgi:hypothetical protein